MGATRLPDVFDFLTQIARAWKFLLVWRQRSLFDRPVTKIEFILRELRAKLWIKPSVMGLVAVGWVTLAYACATWLPDKLQFGVKRDILLNLLGILASTMLTVATFSVSAMVGAFAAVSTTATPRATRIVMADRSSQNALTSFLSAFIYAIVALVALSILEYGNNGRLLLFTAYVAVVIWVLASFVKWVDRISNLGRMGDTLEWVEKTCAETFSSPELMGTLGAIPAEGEAPAGTEIFPEGIAYLRNVDIAELDAVAAELGAVIRLHRRAGAFVDMREPLAVLIGGKVPDEDAMLRIRGAFQMGNSRRVEGDPRFGLILFSEIADRALSPAVNDPGTAISVLGTQIRLLEKWHCQTRSQPKVKYANVEVPAFDPEDLMDDAFTAISRDGAAMFEVGVRLQKSLATLARLGNHGLRAAAIRHSRLALEQSDAALLTDEHRRIIRRLAELVGQQVD